MNTAALYIRIDPKVKSQAKKLAKEMGVSLSTLVTTNLREVVKKRKITIEGETPSTRLIRAMTRAEKNWKEGKHSPIFKTGEEAVAWLEKQGV